MTNQLTSAEEFKDICLEAYHVEFFARRYYSIVADNIVVTETDSSQRSSVGKSCHLIGSEKYNWLVGPKHQRTVHFLGGKKIQNCRPATTNARRGSLLTGKFE
jgi:hypothetical protein